MLKVLLGGVVCSCCVFVGFFLRKRYVARQAIYRDWQAFLVCLGEQIGYLLTPIPKIIADFRSSHPSLLANGLTDGKCPACLNEAEWAEIRAVLDEMGDSDLDGQRARIALAGEHAQAWLDKAQDEVGTKGNLYAKLCVVGGLALWLMML